MAEPVVGVEERDGVVGGLGGGKWAGQSVRGGIVLEMEARRKSGREVRGLFFLPTPMSPVSKADPIFLSEHPLFRALEPTGATGASGATVGVHGVSGHGDGEGAGGLSFELGLTEKQRRDREGVVLPYMDAQGGGMGMGMGEGGRILYQMDAGDDFDEEEDEV